MPSSDEALRFGVFLVQGHHVSLDLFLRSDLTPDSQVSDDTLEESLSVPSTDLEIVKQGLDDCTSVGFLLFELTVDVEFTISTSFGVNDGDVVPSGLFKFEGEPLVLRTVSSDRELELVVSELEVSITSGPALIISDDSPSFHAISEYPRFNGELVNLVGWLFDRDDIILSVKS